MKKTLLRTLSFVLIMGATAPHMAHAFDWSNLSNMGRAAAYNARTAASTVASYIPTISTDNIRTYAQQAAVKGQGLAKDAASRVIAAAPKTPLGKACVIIPAAVAGTVGGMRLVKKMKERYIDPTEQEKKMIRYMLTYYGPNFPLYKYPAPIAPKYTVGQRIEEISKTYRASKRIEQLQELQNEITENVHQEMLGRYMENMREVNESYSS